MIGVTVTIVFIIVLCLAHPSVITSAWLASGPTGFIMSDSLLVNGTVSVVNDSSSAQPIDLLAIIQQQSQVQANLTQQLATAQASLLQAQVRLAKAPTLQAFNGGESTITGTYTLPTNPSPIYIKVTLCGGGGGGGASAVNGANDGSAGETTSFGQNLLYCGGGNGGSYNGGTGGSYSSCSQGGYQGWTIPGGGGGGGTGVTAYSTDTDTQTYVAGGAGGNSMFGGGGASALSCIAGSPGIVCGGGGGGGAGNYGNVYGGGGGGAGAYLSVTIPNPSSSYAYSVGAGGSGGSAALTGCSVGSAAGGNGGPGMVVVEEFYS